MVFILLCRSEPKKRFACLCWHSAVPLPPFSRPLLPLSGANSCRLSGVIPGIQRCVPAFSGVCIPGIQPSAFPAFSGVCRHSGPRIAGLSGVRIPGIQVRALLAIQVRALLDSAVCALLAIQRCKPHLILLPLDLSDAMCTLGNFISF